MQYKIAISYQRKAKDLPQQILQFYKQDELGSKFAELKAAN